MVDVLNSEDTVNLRLIGRPDLGVTFTKIHCWRLTQYSKCVFLDADCVVSLQYLLVTQLFLETKAFTSLSLLALLKPSILLWPRFSSHLGLTKCWWTIRSWGIICCSRYWMAGLLQFRCFRLSTIWTDVFGHFELRTGKWLFWWYSSFIRARFLSKYLKDYRGDQAY